MPASRVEPLNAERAVANEPSVIDVCDEASHWCRRQAYAEAAYVLGRQLADPSLSLHALCRILEQLSRSIG
ncbi:hypothetical protein [Aromatoleum sp.]|uniref:hypothetical protein n=1 Tax=Aromatoleum sp. TaxID=2307007 RepID=UPI002FC991CB